MNAPEKVHANALKMERTEGGIACPRCGQSTAVGDSRPHGNAIKRRRYCKCGYRFTTFEIMTDEAPEFVEMIDALTGRVAAARSILGDLADDVEHIRTMAANLRELNEVRPGTKKQKESAG